MYLHASVVDGLTFVMVECQCMAIAVKHAAAVCMHLRCDASLVGDWAGVSTVPVCSQAESVLAVLLLRFQWV
jgi:hypothetical protein